MTMQLRPRGSSGPMYSPERDFAHNYPQMIKCVIDAFNRDYWPTLIDTLGGDPAFDAAVQAKDAYCKFVEICTDDPAESIDDVLTRSGFTAVPEVGRVAFLAMLGQVMTGQLFVGLRDVTALTDKPACLAALLQGGDAVRRALNGIDLTTEQTRLTDSLQQVINRMSTSGMGPREIDLAVTAAQRNVK